MTKTKKHIILNMILIFIVISAAILLSINVKDKESAFAAERSGCKATFNYENFYHVTGRSEYKTRTRFGTNVTSGVVIDKNLSETTVEIFLTSPLLSNCEVLESNGLINDEELGIQVESGFEICSILVKNSKDEIISENNQNYLQLINLEDNIYNVFVLLEGEISTRNDIYYQYTVNCSFSFIVETIPIGQIIKSNDDNSVKFTWKNDNWFAKINGNEYIKDLWITEEGSYEIVLYNRSGRFVTYNFDIGHYYILIKEIDSTCKEFGYIQSKCLHCGDVNFSFKEKKEHQYISEEIKASCENQGGVHHTCLECGYSYKELNGTLPTGHNYSNEVITAPTCTTDGLRRSTCEVCGDVFDTKITADGHNYTITDSTTQTGKTTRIYTCTVCAHSFKQELGDQYKEVANYVEYLFEQYEPYMWLVLLASAGVWSIVIGVMIAIAQKNEDKEKARKMLINYVIGLVVIAVIVVACPFLIRGIAALVT